jgi:hypothetical protein
MKTDGELQQRSRAIAAKAWGVFAASILALIATR